MDSLKVAILGGGPAGLTAAAMLREAGVPRVRVFEADSRPGGKCLTIEHGGALHELGTCYTTLDHKVINRWMRRLGIEQTPLGAQMFDGRPFMGYVSGGTPARLAAETMRYLDLWNRHRGALGQKGASKEVREEWAMPVRDWLIMHHFPLMERFMYRAITTLGYGLLDDVSLYQALRWCTPSLFMTGLLNSLRMPVTGWQDFWDRLAKSLDVHLNEPVTAIERTKTGGLITTSAGTFEYENLIVAAPLDCFAAISRANETEARVAEGIEWGRYVITLAEVDNWFTGYNTDAYSDAAAPGTHGKLLGARRAPAAMRHAEPPKGTDTYLLAQQHFGNYAEQGLQKQLEDGVTLHGGKYKSTVVRKDWRYFPRYRPDAIRDGLVDWMEDIQGVNRTWFTGSTFSHEAVSSVANFNVKLVKRILPQLAA